MEGLFFPSDLDPPTAGEIITQTRESIIKTPPGQIAEDVLTSRARRAFSSKEKRGKESWVAGEKNSEELAEGGAPRLGEAQLFLITANFSLRLLSPDIFQVARCNM